MIFANFLTVLSVLVGSCPHLRSRNAQQGNGHRSLSNAEVSTDSFKTMNFAPFCIKTNGATVVPSKQNTCDAYFNMRSQFEAATASSMGTYLQSNIYGIGARLTFHDAGEYDQSATDTAGPDGCLSSSTDNAGLVESTSLVTTVIEPVWQSVCDSISRADFWALWGKMTVEAADPTVTLSTAYQFGRVDSTSCDIGSGRLPSASQGITELTRVFVTQMGLTLNDSVTLSGAHTLGHVHIATSGYGYTSSTSDKANSTTLNAWDATPYIFDNDYFESMYDKPWVNQAAVTSGLNQWGGASGSIGLTSDMALFYSPAYNNSLGVYGQICQPDSAYLPGQLTNYGCTFPTNLTMPSTAALAGIYANPTTGNAAFLAGFSTAYPRMTTVGYGVPVNIDGATSTGRLGTLTAIDLATCVPPVPTYVPTAQPTPAPTISSAPTKAPSAIPTAAPTTKTPTAAPSTKTPSAVPTSAKPSKTPTAMPTTKSPTV